MKEAACRTASLMVSVRIASLLAVAIGLAPAAAYGQNAAAASNTIATNDIIRRVWDANLSPVHTKPVYWIDDSTLLVTADKEPGSGSAEVPKQNAAWLYVW